MHRVGGGQPAGLETSPHYPERVTAADHGPRDEGDEHVDDLRAGERVDQGGAVPLADPSEAGGHADAGASFPGDDLLVGRNPLADDDEEDDDDEDGEFADEAVGDPFAAFGALFGGSGGANPLAGLLEQAQQMQAGMEDAQRRLAEQTVSGTAGGGLVRATVSGTGELQQLRIDPSVVDPSDVETLADLIVAAVRVASEEARSLGERTMTGSMPDFGGPGGPDLAGLGLPDFAGLGGLAGPGGGLGLPSSIPDLGAGMIPGAGPVGRPLGDDAEGDDLGPSGDVRG